TAPGGAFRIGQDIARTQQPEDQPADREARDVGPQLLTEEPRGVLMGKFDGAHGLFPTLDRESALTGAPRLGAQINSPNVAIPQRRPSLSTNASGVVRGTPLFRPRTVSRAFGPIS